MYCDPFMNKRNALKWIATGIGVAGAMALLGGCAEKKQNFSSIDITGADYARDFTLTDHNGQARSIKDFEGKVVVMFFGFTQCPDVCPTSMLEMAAVKKQLGKNGDRLQGVFVTVDPERDTPEVLKAYMANFDPTFLALYTSAEGLAALAKDYKMYYKKVPGPTPTSYSMDHSAGSYIYDTHGKLRLYARYGTDSPSMASDIALLLKNS